MNTGCIPRLASNFTPLRNRGIRVQFDGGAITSDGGGLLLREVKKPAASRIIHTIDLSRTE
jgi:hypothetical protein